MKQFSIRQYVEWLTLIPLLLMAVSLETYFLYVRSSDLERDLMQDSTLIARQLASSSEYGVFSNNKPFLRNIAHGALLQPDVRGVIIMNNAPESLVEAGEFFDVKEAVADTILVPPGRLSQTGSVRASKIMGLVNLENPVLSRNESLWIYQPIIPLQVPLNDFESGPAKQTGAVIVEVSRTRTNQAKSQMLWITIGGTLLFLVFVFVLVYRASRRITSPICELNDAVQTIGKGHLKTRVPASTHIIELDSLAQGINAMTIQLQAESESLRQQAEQATRLAAIAFESHEGMVVTDATGVIMRINQAFTRITGYTDEDAVGKTTALLKSGHHDADFYMAMWNHIVETGSWQGEIWNRHKNGDMYLVWVNITEVKKEDGKAAYYVATYTDITIRKAAENEIKNLAFYDALTHLPNRRLLIDRLSIAIASSKRNGRYGAVLFLDMDNFKPLNDQHGHALGDLLLIEVARRLISCVREMDTIARFGGDEFVVILSDLDVDKDESIRQISITAEKIRIAVAEPYTLKTQQGGATTTINHRCTSSIGVVLFGSYEADPEDVLKRADLAMYKAKRDGRNLVRFYE